MFTRISSLIKKHDLLYFILLLPFLVYSLFPFWWMLMTSIKKNSELYDLSSNPFWVRDGVTIEHYSYLLKDTLFPVWMKNSLIVGVVTTAISVAVSILAAYALARLQFRGASFSCIGHFCCLSNSTNLVVYTFSSSYWFARDFRLSFCSYIYLSVFHGSFFYLDVAVIF